MAPQMLVTEPLEPPMMSTYSIDSFSVQLDKMPTHSPTEVEMSWAQSEALKLRKTRSLKGLPADLLSLGTLQMYSIYIYIYVYSIRIQNYSLVLEAHSSNTRMPLST